MAKRRVRVIKIDGGNIVDDTGCSIRSALEQAGIENVVSVVSGGEIIQAADFDRPLPAYDMLTNHKPIEKGASLRDRLLDYECTLIATRFLVHFDSQTRTLELDEDALIIRASSRTFGASPMLLDGACGAPLCDATRQ